jgi:L-threonylcarbamoyladenylate synthase
MPGWLRADNPRAAARVAQAIRVGGLVILPTDTVYGIAADLWQEVAVAALYEAKQRPPDKAIPILLSHFEAIFLVATEVPDSARRLAEAFWPGPLTITVPKRRLVPEIVSSLPTIGVRIPAHDVTRAAIRACGGALAVTSANRSGEESPLNAQEAVAALPDVDVVIDGGPCSGGIPSTVVDLSGDVLKIVRAGPISEAELRRVLA